MEHCEQQGALGLGSREQLGGDANGQGSDNDVASGRQLQSTSGASALSQWTETFYPAQQDSPAEGLSHRYTCRCNKTRDIQEAACWHTRLCTPC